MRLLAWLFGPVLAAWLPGSCALALDFGTGPILLIADQVRYDQEQGLLVAEGNVEITRGERRLFADIVRYDERLDLLEAADNVILLEPTGEAIFAEEVRLTGDLQTGVVEQLRARLPDNSLFAAAQGRRIEGTRIEMDRATFTPCEVCPDSAWPPLWQLRAQRVVHDQEAQTVVYRNAFFDLFGVPVLYTPYFSHPDPTVERQSGFLAPTVGSDNDLGFTLETPYYFALAPNYDFTFSPIITTRENAVLTGEWRHLLPAGAYGLGGSITYGSESGAIQEKDTFRGHVEGDGRFALRDRWRWGYDLEIATDDTYLQRYGFSNQSILTSRLFTEGIWERNYAAINGYGFQGLRPNDVQGRIPIVLPLAQVELASDPMWLGSRFLFDGNLLALNRTEGLDTRRISATGGWQLPWLGAIGDRYQLTLSLRGDAYHTDGDPVTLDDDGSNTEFRAFPRATLDWSWPLIGEGVGFTPVIEPVVMATWAPTGLNEAAIPNEDSRDLEFDDTSLFEPDRYPGLDRVEGGAKVSYGLRMGAYGEAGEFLNILFGQSYRFSGRDEFDAEAGLEDKFSDFVGRVDLTPDPWLNVRYRFRLDRDSLSLLRNEVRAFVGPRRLRFDVTYLSLEDEPAAEEFREREEITAGVLVGLTRGLSIRAQTRRNLRQGRTVANNYGLVYRNPCLLLVAALEQRFTENRDATGGTTFTVRVTFEHLGEVVADSGLFGF